MAILVIDDDLQICRSLKSILQAKGYTVTMAMSGEEGISAAIDLTPEMIILDLSLPGMSGQDVCMELRNWYAGPILVLSVHEDTSAKVAALDHGADDYLTKPFAPSELLARLRALHRRMKPSPATATVIRAGELVIDLTRHIVTRSGHPITLTPIEYKILALLAAKIDCVVTNQALLDAIWESDSEHDLNALRTHISNLRKKIEIDPRNPQHLLTEYGVGLRFISEV